MGAANENELFERGIARFNAGEFFEAHEAWEEIWLRAPAEEKAFLQGIIQVAAAFHHYMRGNLGGAKSLLAAGLAKIKEYPHGHWGINLGKLRDEGQAWLDALGAGQEAGSEKLPKIRRLERNADSRAG